MINRLRKKFILLSTVSLLLLLVVIVTSSSLLIYRELAVNADAVLDTLADRQGRYDKKIPLKPSKDDVPDEVDRENDIRVGNGSFFGDRSLSPEVVYESRFFMVILSKEGQITEINTENILMIDREQAEEYAKAVLDKKNTRGFMGVFRYLKTEVDNDICVIFLDCGRKFDTFKGSIIINCLISFAGFLASMVIIIIFSKKIVQPVSESYEKQKQFISMAGHELKTPLTIIDADAEVLSMELEEENEWLSDICSQTKRLAVLTNDLLRLSRMDENREQYTMIEFPISDVISETVQSFQTLAHSKDRKIIADITPMLSYTGDEKSIRQITGILLDNAIKYSKSKDIELRLKKKGHNIVLSVENSSEPLSDAELGQLFDRFYRTEQSRNSEKGGYGLGLSIAKSIVDAHRGKITAAAPRDGHVQITVALRS